MYRKGRNKNQSGSWEEGESEGEEGVADPEKYSPLAGGFWRVRVHVRVALEAAFSVARRVQDRLKTGPRRV